MKHLLKVTIVLAAFSLLSGCVTIPLATGIALGTLGVAAGSLAVTAMHDCRQDGKCKGALLPK
jgi:hypothetical protein